MNVQNVLPRDAIPSVDDPAFGSSYFGDPDDEVIVVDGDPPRAYPIRILSYHEIVNDVVDGRPVAVTWCPICWSGAVYDRTVEGRTLTFGVSGKLADDALVMYDRETETEWKQTTGVAIDGPLAGTQLPVLAAPVVTWKRFRADYPDGLVLQPADGGGRSDESAAARYDMAPYEGYVEREAFGLYGMRGEGEPRSWDREDLDAKTVVLGVERGGEAVGYSLPQVERAGGLVTDTVDGDRVLVVATDTGCHVYEAPAFDFEMRAGTIHGDGTTWDSATGESADGRRLDRVPARRLFAFAWQDTHGPDSFYFR
jgi:hypothetical protein